MEVHIHDFGRSFNREVFDHDERLDDSSVVDERICRTELRLDLGES